MHRLPLPHLPFHTASERRNPRLRTSTLLSGVALGALGLLVLAGCGGTTGADPLLAARINGHPVTLGLYDSMVRFTTAEYALQGHFSDLQSPTGRQNLNASGQTAMNWLINGELAREQLAANHLHVTADEQKSAQTFLDDYKSQIQQELEMQPNNLAMQQLQASLTPDVQRIIVERLANEQALADQVSLPTAHLRAIFTNTRAEADDLLKQVQQGADFGTLARDHSTDAPSAAKYGDLGTVYIGQDAPAASVGQLTSALTTQVFAPGAHPPKDFVVPAGPQFALVEIMQRGNAQVPQADRAGMGVTEVETWLSTVVQPQAGVDQYVALR